MNAYTLWTASHVTGAMLVAAILFVPGVALYMLVKDKGGPQIFGQPPHEWLRLVHEHPRPWRWATLSFLGAFLITLVGYALFAKQLQDAGDPGFSLVGLLAFGLGTLLWVIILAARLSVDPWAGKELAARGSVPEAYEALRIWNGAMFQIFTALAFTGALAFGGAILASHLLPGWVGWGTVIYSALGLVLFAATRDAIPAIHLLMPIVIGTMLLLT